MYPTLVSYKPRTCDTGQNSSWVLLHQVAGNTCGMENRPSAASEQPVPTGEQIHSYVAKHGIIIYNTHHHHYHTSSTITSAERHQSGASQHSHGDIGTRGGILSTTGPAQQDHQAVTKSPVEAFRPSSRDDMLRDELDSRASERDRNPQTLDSRATGGGGNDAAKELGKKAVETGTILAVRDWSTKGERDAARLFPSGTPRLVAINDGKNITPAITVSHEMAECISKSFRAERHYKSLWTKIDMNGAETGEKKARAVKDAQRSNEELAKFDTAMEASSSAPTPEQFEERRTLVTRAYLTRVDLNRLLDAETQLWGDCNLAEQACRDAWENVGALLLPVWVRARVIESDSIDETRLPKGDERGITRRIDCEPPTSLRRLRDDVKESADALRKTRTRFEHMCHHYSSWAPWEDGVAAEFRDNVVKPAFLDMLRDEMVKLEEARVAYRRAVGRAWREKIPDVELDFDCGEELESTEMLLLDEEDAMFLKEVPMNVLEAWRRRNLNCAPAETPLYPIEERGFAEEVQPWESKSKALTEPHSEQNDPIVQHKRTKDELVIDSDNKNGRVHKTRRRNRTKNSPTVSQISIKTRDNRVRQASRSKEDRHPKRSQRQTDLQRFANMDRDQRHDVVAKYKRRSVTDFFKTSRRR